MHKLKAKRDRLIREIVKASRRGVTGSVRVVRLQKRIADLNLQIRAHVAGSAS